MYSTQQNGRHKLSWKSSSLFPTLPKHNHGYRVFYLLLKQKRVAINGHFKQFAELSARIAESRRFDTWTPERGYLCTCIAAVLSGMVNFILMKDRQGICFEHSAWCWCRLQNSRFRRTESAVSVILVCEAEIRLRSLARPVVGIFSVARVRKKYDCFAV